MKVMNEWQLPSVIDEYVVALADPIVSSYENEVNFPDLVKLIPSETESLLDFGCGPGGFTDKLTQTVENVIGADMTQMITIAQKRYPKIKFIEWDGSKSLPESLGTFDVIFSKLTLQFIEDIDMLAVNFSKVLNPKGAVIFSVPNPEYIAQKCGLEYEVVTQYMDKVRGTNIEIRPIHRPKQVYIDTFVKAGFCWWNGVSLHQCKIRVSLRG